MKHELSTPYEHTRLRDVRDPAETLLAGLQFAQDLELDHWVSCGTLLGLHRDGGFIPNDTDVDIGVRGRYTPFHFLHQKMMELAPKRFVPVRCVTERKRPMQLAFQDMEQNRCVLDYYFYYEDWPEEPKDLLVNFNPTSKRLVKPKHLFDNLQRRALLARAGEGIAIPVPEDIEAYLEMRYGKNWRTPAQKKGIYDGTF